ncbi:MAG: RNA polymerase sigma factor [Pseudomonadota bacterium]
MEHQYNEVEVGLEQLLPRLSRFALTVTRNNALAEELVQDTCVRALHYADKYRPGTHLDRWCFMVMMNVWRSRFKRAKIDEADDDALDHVASSDPNPEASLYVQQVIDAVDQLSECQKSVVVLVYGRGFAYKEAASELDIPIGTVMSRLYAAKARLAYLAE